MITRQARPYVEQTMDVERKLKMDWSYCQFEFQMQQGDDA